jgi:hypothetical protein
MQHKRLDFDETFAPVTHMISIRTITAVATTEGLKVEHLNIDSTYLNEIIDKKIYMHQPPSFVDKDQPNTICLLEKSLYGINQAGHIWNGVAHSCMLVLGFHWSWADPCVYILC